MYGDFIKTKMLILFKQNLKNHCFKTELYLHLVLKNQTKSCHQMCRDLDENKQQKQLNACLNDNQSQNLRKLQRLDIQCFVWTGALTLLRTDENRARRWPTVLQLQLEGCLLQLLQLLFLIFALLQSVLLHSLAQVILLVELACCFINLSLNSEVSMT